MLPRRPDSAKSRVTQKTLDTQINQSKFAQTFTSYTSFQQQKKDEFLKYLQEKNNDPKFKKYQNTTLQEIPQKPKQQLSKINSKPFEKRTTKVLQKSKAQSHKKQQNENNKKISQQSNSKWAITEQRNAGKKQLKYEMNSTSKSFAQKNKEKLSSISSGIKSVDGQKKIQLKGFKVVQRGQRQLSNRICQVDEKDASQLQGSVKKLDSNSFGEANRSIPNWTKQDEKNKRKIMEQQRNNESSEQQRRQQRLLEISQFIDELQTKNMDYYPTGYEQFVEKSQQSARSGLQGLELIDIKDFMVEPTESDFMKVKRLIRENQKRLDGQQRINQENENMSSSTVSFLSVSKNANGAISNSNSNKPWRKSAITSEDKSAKISMTLEEKSSVMSMKLDEVIEGSRLEQQCKEQGQNQLFLSRISSKELKQRNVFLTQILKGRVTRQELNKLQQMNRSQMKWHKLQSSLNQEQESNDIDIVEINMMKKKSNRVIQRNIISASGQIYKDCDYLSEENKLRLSKLLDGQMEQSPFALSQWEAFAIRRIDEGIRLYRQYSHNLNQQLPQNQFSPSINQQLLPKDPILRKQAQRKILKEKLYSINSRLQQIQSIVITENQIQQQLQLYHHLPPSQFTQSLIAQRKLQVTEIQEKTKMAIQMLAKVEGQKSAIQAALQEMQESYDEYAKECRQYEELTAQQITNRELKELEGKKATIYQLQQSVKMIQRETQQSITQFNVQLSAQIQILREIEDMNNFGEERISGQERMRLFRENITVEQLDEMFERKLEENVDIQLMKSKVNKVNEEQDNKQNISIFK